MSEAIQMTELNPPELSRTYHFRDGETVRFENVTHFAARPSGTHRLRTKDGRFHIISSGWLHIELEMQGWTL